MSRCRFRVSIYALLLLVPILGGTACNRSPDRGYGEGSLLQGLPGGPNDLNPAQQLAREEAECKDLCGVFDRENGYCDKNLMRNECKDECGELDETCHCDKEKLPNDCRDGCGEWVVDEEQGCFCDYDKPRNDCEEDCGFWIANDEECRCDYDKLHNDCEDECGFWIENEDECRCDYDRRQNDCEDECGFWIENEDECRCDYDRRQNDCEDECGFWIENEDECRCDYDKRLNDCTDQGLFWDDENCRCNEEGFFNGVVGEDWLVEEGIRSERECRHRFRRGVWGRHPRFDRFVCRHHRRDLLIGELFEVGDPFRLERVTVCFGPADQDYIEELRISRQLLNFLRAVGRVTDRDREFDRGFADREVRRTQIEQDIIYDIDRFDPLDLPGELKVGHCPQPVSGEVPCNDDQDCKDDDSNTVDSCDLLTHRCVFTPANGGTGNGTGNDPGNGAGRDRDREVDVGCPNATFPCTNDRECECLPATLSPNFYCHTYTCEVTTGQCVTAPVTGNPVNNYPNQCTIDTCLDGKLQIGSPVITSNGLEICDDGLECTNDICDRTVRDPKDACSHPPVVCESSGVTCASIVCIEGAGGCTLANPVCNGTNGPCQQACTVASALTCTDISKDPDNCGECAETGEAANTCTGATPLCRAGACVASAGVCTAPAPDDCGLAIGCVDLSSNSNHCGPNHNLSYCGYNCVGKNYNTDTCTNGICGNGECKRNFGDCNNNKLDGCESNLLSDENNCGTCGNVCQSDVCINGMCA